MQGAVVASDGVPVGIGGSGQQVLRVVEAVAEGRGADGAPVPAAVHGEVDAGAVPADEAVVHAGHEVVRVVRVGRDVLLGLPAVGAVLVHPHVAAAGALGAAGRLHGDAGAVRRHSLRPCGGPGVGQQL